MEEDSNSWLRRTKFSHTVCHRLDSSRLSSFPLRIESESLSGLKSRPRAVSFNRNQITDAPKIVKNPNVKKPRSVSPAPETAISDTFLEAKHERKRFSTPEPRRKEQHHEKRIMGKVTNKDSRDVVKSMMKSPSRSPILSSSKHGEKRTMQLYQ